MTQNIDVLIFLVFIIRKLQLSRILFLCPVPNQLIARSLALYRDPFTGPIVWIGVVQKAASHWPHIWCKYDLFVMHEQFHNFLYCIFHPQYCTFGNNLAFVYTRYYVMPAPQKANHMSTVNLPSFPSGLNIILLPIPDWSVLLLFSRDNNDGNTQQQPPEADVWGPTRKHQLLEVDQLVRSETSS